MHNEAIGLGNFDASSSFVPVRLRTSGIWGDLEDICWDVGMLSDQVPKVREMAADDARQRLGSSRQRFDDGGGYQFRRNRPRYPQLDLSGKCALDYRLAIDRAVDEVRRRVFRRCDQNPGEPVCDAAQFLLPEIWPGVSPYPDHRRVAPVGGRYGEDPLSEVSGPLDLAVGSAHDAPLRTSAPEISPSDRRHFSVTRVFNHEKRGMRLRLGTRGWPDPRNDAWQLRLRHDGYAHFRGLCPAALIAAARAAIDADLSHQLRPDAADRIRPPVV